MQPLFDSQGQLQATGSYHSFKWDYKRSMIKAPWYRIKAWDEYYIGNEDYFVVIALSEVSFRSIHAITLYDIKQRQVTQKHWFYWGPKSFKQHSTSPFKGDVRIVEKNYQIEVTHKDDLRVIDVRFDKFRGKENLVGRLMLTNTPEASLVTVLPFEQKHEFKYQCTMNSFRVEGSLSLGHDVIRFQPQNTFATFDWVRGAWKHKHRGMWGSISGVVNHHTIGLILHSIGEATVQPNNSMVIYRGTGHMFSHVECVKNETSAVANTWIISSQDSCLCLEFSPIFDSELHLSRLNTDAKQNYVFGTFNGIVQFKDNEKIIITQLFGFISI